MSKVGIGIVGSRFQADCIAASVKAMPEEMEVVAVASPTPGNAEAFAQRHGIAELLLRLPRDAARPGSRDDLDHRAEPPARADHDRRRAAPESTSSARSRSASRSRKRTR